MNDQELNAARTFHGTNHEDELEPIPVKDTSSLSLANPYLSRPSKDTAEPAPTVAPLTTPTSSRKDRLYIGNIHHTVDEYTLLQIFQKYGRVAHLDFLFHKAGPMKGRPRGYAFLEYVEKEDALKAVVELHDKPLRGRNIQVKFANQVTMDPSMSQGSGTLGRIKSDPGRATALSLLKASSSGTRGHGTEDKIRAMERKLQQMQSGLSSSVEKSINLKAAGLPEKPLPSLVEAAGISSERVRDREKASFSERFQMPMKATAVAVGQPVAEILQPSTRPSASNTTHQQISSIQMPPKGTTTATRKQLGIKSLPGVKLKSKR